MLSALPLFTGAVIAPFFFPHNLTTPVSTLFSVIIAGLLYIALGVKDLILIRREALLEIGAYALLYSVLLLFFMQALSPVFLGVWLFAVFCTWLSFSLLAGDYRIALLFATLFGEIIWVVSWLPVGFLSATNMCFVFGLFAGDTVRKNRISMKNSAILGALFIFIAATAYWRL